MPPRSPSTVHVAVTCADDTLVVVQVVTHEFNGDGTLRRVYPASAAAIAAEVARATATLEAVRRPIKGWRPLDPRDLPGDRGYRNAWRDDGQAIVHDMPTARQIHLDRVRTARATVLPEKDAAWMRALGQKDQAEADRIEVERQVLRDLPETLGVEQAESVEALTALWPADLPRPD